MRQQSEGIQETYEVLIQKGIFRTSFSEKKNVIKDHIIFNVLSTTAF